MIPDKLKDDFNSLRNMFDELKREIDKNVVREENYKGEFYEISPYSYQRNRFKQGKIVGNVTSLKTTNSRTLSIVSGRKAYPPKPGLTVITKTWSTRLSTFFTASTGVPGLITTLALTPAARIFCKAP